MTNLHDVAAQRDRRLTRADTQISRCPDCGAWTWQGICTTTTATKETA